MVISEVIKKLQEIQNKHGDLEVTINGWSVTEDDICYDEDNVSLIIWY